MKIYLTDHFICKRFFVVALLQHTIIFNVNIHQCFHLEITFFGERAKYSTGNEGLIVIKGHKGNHSSVSSSKQ